MAEPPRGPIVGIMRKKYGPASLEMLDVWVKKFRFPAVGSLSKQELQNLEFKLRQEE